MDTKANLEVATAIMHEDVYDVKKQRGVSRLKKIVKEIERGKARGTCYLI